MGFNIDYKKFTRRLFPHFLRKELILSYFHSAIKPLQDVNDQLVTLRLSIQNKLAFTSQVIYLEKLLNDTFDPILRRLFIENTSTVLFLYIRNQSELRQPQFYLRNQVEGATPVYARNRSEVSGDPDFIVHVPLLLAVDQDHLRSQVDIYKLAGKQYTVNEF